MVSNDKLEQFHVFLWTSYGSKEKPIEPELMREFVSRFLGVDGHRKQTFVSNIGKMVRWGWLELTDGNYLVVNPDSVTDWTEYAKDVVREFDSEHIKNPS